MKLSPNGRALIQGFEGLSLKAYRDADGYSIGYGHFIGKDPSLTSRTITASEAEALFDQDLVKFDAVVSLETPNALAHEHDAMVSLAYNIGTAGFSTSTVARKMKLGDRQGAADAFLLWNKSTGPDGVRRENPVLVKRRAKERDVFLNGYTQPGHFPTPPQQSTDSSWPVHLASTSSPLRTASLISVAAVAAAWLLHRFIH